MNFVKKIIAYPLSILYYIFFFLVLFIFHPLQWLAFNLGGYKAHKKVVDYLNFCLTKGLYILGIRIEFINKQTFPKGVPFIIVSNHQNLNDIPPIFWYLRKHHPKFVSKIELGKGIPSISYNLRHGGSALINRKNPKQALTALANFGKYIEKHNRSAVIFPEGTRSKNGVPKRFSENGLKILVKKAPSSYIVPLTINNSWKILENGYWPLTIGLKIIFEVHKPIKSDSLPFDELFLKTEKVIKDAIHNS
ncbi:MAG: 1-acyl-sn-glycerol-3-phosphate acyltransferase [Flavobacteriaceae bacterium]|nr:1-acyl-sn-glycerol-3-phosphate acyltransferase [Flavobacteriaceae bacterium]